MTRLVPSTAQALGMVRAIVHGVFLLSVLFTSFSNLSRLPVTILRPTGMMQIFSWAFYDTLLTPGGMLALKCAMVISLSMSAFGYLTKFSTISSALLVIFYQGLLRSFGHFNHDEMIGIYYLLILVFTPCGDNFSVDCLPLASPRRGRRSYIYGYPILLMRVLMAWVYFSSALIKLRVAGLAYFNPDNLASLAISHSLDNLHDTHFRLAFWLPEIRPFLPLCVGVIIVWELLFPFAVWSKRARPWILSFGALFHIATLVFMNVFFPFQLAMYLVFVDWPTAARMFFKLKILKRTVKHWRQFYKAPVEAPGMTIHGDVIRNVLFFDNDNAFFSAWILWLQRKSGFVFVAQPNLSSEITLPGPLRRWARLQKCWVVSDDRVFGGSRALTEMLSLSGHGFLVAILESTPLRPLTWLSYRLICLAGQKNVN